MIWEIDETTRGIEGLDERGRPRPEYAASLGLIPAPFGRRALAAAIEAAVYVLLQLPMLLGALPAIVAASTADAPAEALAGSLVVVAVTAAASTVLTTVYIIVQLVLHGRRGVTLGKAITGLRSVNVRTLERPGFWRGAVVRALVLWGSFIVPVVGPLVVIALSPFFDGEGRGRSWPDAAAATWFVDARKGLNPYDAKRMRIARKTAATDLADVRSDLPSLATPAGPRASAYIPVARSSGGVLGATRADPSALEPPSAPAAAPGAGAIGFPSLLDPSAPSAPAAPSAADPAPAAHAAAPGAGSPGAAAWVPPTLLPDPSPASVPPPVQAGTPVARGQEPTRAATAAPGPAVSLLLDTGRVIDVGGGILIGRDPAGRAGEAGLTLVPLEDPTMSVSKTHLALLRAAGDTVVVDRGSTNGTILVRDGVEHALVAGEPVAVRADDTIRFGDRHGRIRIG